MRDYAKIAPKFWAGSETGRSLRRQGSEAMLVAAYLMSSPHSNMLGLFFQPLMYLAYETGLGMEGASKGLAGCIEAGFCQYDHDSEVVWVREMALYQIGAELKPSDKRCAGVQREYDGLPNNPFLGEFFQRYSGVFHLKRSRGLVAAPPLPPVASPAPAVAAAPAQAAFLAPEEAPSKGLRSQEQEQEQEQEQCGVLAEARERAPEPPDAADAATPQVDEFFDPVEEPWDAADFDLLDGDVIEAAEAIDSGAAEAAREVIAVARGGSTRLPDDWRLPKGWGEWAMREFGVDQPELIRREAASFADHYRAKSGSSGLSRDWQATWRNWCRKSHALLGTKAPARSAAASADVVRQTVPGREGRDPALLRIEQDRLKAVPPSPEQRAKMAALRARMVPA